MVSSMLKYIEKKLTAFSSLRDYLECAIFSYVCLEETEIILRLVETQLKRKKHFTLHVF